MKDEKNYRTKRLNFNLTEVEYKRLHSLFSNTTCPKMSNYVRKVLLGKPVVVTYRNQSLDELMEEAILLRKELNNIGNNFNQAVNILHNLHQLPELQQWLETYENSRQVLLEKMEAIKDQINKIGAQWLQS
ncbi:plasmid mobilization protein [Solitalea lacus]|uniref:plasmid mobilization protein n=1 Tax=Solitalea lacus TaxID=2911172 RepID=UPI001EDC540C|nr:plasmid mobilization relaxosome protein MobC [Solitalea lacus]UKJ09201.1 plasmid mobilization relaxosome protein MobC [Solitalea lacus]